MSGRAETLGATLGAALAAGVSPGLTGLPGVGVSVGCTGATGVSVGGTSTGGVGVTHGQALGGGSLQPVSSPLAELAPVVAAGALAADVGPDLAVGGVPEDAAADDAAGAVAVDVAGHGAAGGVARDVAVDEAVDAVAVVVDLGQDVGRDARARRRSGERGHEDAGQAGFRGRARGVLFRVVEAGVEVVAGFGDVLTRAARTTGAITGRTGLARAAVATWAADTACSEPTRGRSGAAAQTIPSGRASRCRPAPAAAIVIGPTDEGAGRIARRGVTAGGVAARVIASG